MDTIHIQGGIALQGKVRIQGSKNAALPVLAATLLVGEQSLIRNCPRITDVYSMVSLLKNLGCTVNWQDDGLCIDSTQIQCKEMKSEAVTGMRSSLCLLGALIGRCGEVVMEHPGGCVIGERPIDMHLDALRQMGVVFREENGQLHAFTDCLHGANIHLPFPSVGATENVVLAAVLAEGETVLEGAALEPEIGALCRYLQNCGAKIDGVDTDRLVIQGGTCLYGTDYRIPSDRIVAGTYLFACVGTGGEVYLEEAPWQDMTAVLETAGRMGARMCTDSEGIFVQAPERPKFVPYICTAPHPGFPTDLQSVVLAVAARGTGDSLIRETIFENRFRVVKELRLMGACLEEEGEDSVLVHGVEELHGALVAAGELRGGAALVAAGLMAKGETVVTGCQYIYRGYENICRDFRELGARVTSA